MPGIVRIKTWNAREVLVYSDLNNEFDNIINNLSASNVDGYSNTVSQMRETADPGTVGSESLALRISDEIERLRFAINRIVGKTYWYEAPARSLSTTYVNAANYFVPNGSTGYYEVVSEFVSAGFLDSAEFANPFFYSTGSTDKVFSDTKYSIKNDPLFGRFFYVSPVASTGDKTTISLWFKNFAANDNIYFNPVSGIRLYLDSNGFIHLEQSLTSSVTNGSKEIREIVGNTSLAGSSTFNNVIIRWSYGSALDLLLNGTLVGTQSVVPTPNYPSTNVQPVLMAKRAFTSYTEALTNPGTDLPSVYGWTAVGTPVANATSGGIWGVDPGIASNTFYYSKALFSSIPTNGVYFEMKYKLRNTVLTTVNAQSGNHFGFYFRVDATNVGIHCRIIGSTIDFSASSNATTITGGSLLTIDHNSLDWTSLAIVVKAAETFVYVNGRLEGSFVTPTSDATVGDTFFLGKTLAGTSTSAFDVEYFFAGNVPTSSPAYYVPNNTNTQYISDFCCIRDYLTDATTVQALQSSSPFLLFGRPDFVKNYSFNRSFVSNVSVASTTTQLIGQVAEFVSDGRTPVKLNFKMNVRMGAATAGAYNFASYLNIRSESLQNVTGNQFINQAGSALNAGVSLMDAQRQDVPASTQMTFPTYINYDEVLPAGNYKVFAYLNNITSAGAVIATNVKCTVSL